jgi:hypothetical protein
MYELARPTLPDSKHIYTKKELLQNIIIPNQIMLPNLNIYTYINNKLPLKTMIQQRT